MSRNSIIAHYFDLEEKTFTELSSYKHSLPLQVIRWVWLSLRTIVFLVRRQPDIVFVVNLPIWLPILVSLWARFNKKKFVIDHHSGLFSDERWNWSLPWLRPVFGGASVSLVTNSYHEQVVRRLGGHTYRLGALVLPDEDSVITSNHVDFSRVAVIATLAEDEPIDAVLEAARRLPQYDFCITGNVKRANSEWFRDQPANVQFTGFLPRLEFVSLIRGSFSSLVLTTRDNTMQRGVYESMSLETPIITSKWPLLEQIFYKGVLFVDNSPEDIARAVEKMFQEYEQYKQDVMSLKEEALSLLVQDVQIIKNYLGIKDERDT